jgi:hypothetical protein
MDWNQVGSSALTIAAAVVAPGVSLVTLFLKFRESSGRIRAHTIATESYALAKAIGELGPGDAGSAHAPYLRNWIDGAVYSIMCLAFGLALLQFPNVFQLAEGPGALTWYVMGWFFIVLGAVSFFLVARAIGRRGRGIMRLLRQRFRGCRPREDRVLIADIPTSDFS